jgi:ParB/RepB/Spo0J family partition protein
MGLELIEIDKIHDNPYNPRAYYNPDKVADLASSIEQIGLLEPPQAIKLNPDAYEIAYGGFRLRAYKKLATKNKEKFGKMPLNIVKLTDEQMALFALEENLKRQDMTPLDTALAIDKYFEIFKEATEDQLAIKLSMTQGNISNMRRVVKLPKEVLEKVNEGKINFTMARELCILQGLNAGGDKDEKWLMLDAIKGTTGSYGEPNTVNGIKKSIYSTVRENFPCLDKETGYSYESHQTLFDVQKIGCLKCEKMVKTNRTQSDIAHNCTDLACWEKHQQEHKDRIATEAKAKMTKDLVDRAAKAAENISQEISQAKKEAKKVKADPKLTVNCDKCEDTKSYVACDHVKDPKCRLYVKLASAVPASSPTAAVAQLTQEDIKKLDQLQTKEETAETDEEAIQAQKRRQQLQGREDYPCLSCANIGRCDGTGVRSEIKEGKAVYICKDQTHSVQEVTRKATIEIPKELMDKISGVAGTRAQILDLRDLRMGYYSELKQGHVLLDSALDVISVENAKQCIYHCTEGFHYAFDSAHLDGRTYFVCTNPRCLAQKKAAFTRDKNARGMLRKKAELKAIDQAATETTVIDIPRIKLIFLASLAGRHQSSYSYNNSESEVEWLIKALKLSDQFKDTYSMRNEALPKIMAALNKLPLQELAGMLVKFMLNSFVYQGDIKDYRIQTTSALNLLHVSVEIPKEALEPEKKKLGTPAGQLASDEENEDEEDGDEKE